MACMLDAVSGSAESGSTSEQCVEMHNPQQYRMGFEQAASSIIIFFISLAIYTVTLPFCLIASHPSGHGSWVGLCWETSIVIVLGSVTMDAERPMALECCTCCTWKNTASALLLFTGLLHLQHSVAKWANY